MIQANRKWVSSRCWNRSVKCRMVQRKHKQCSFSRNRPVKCGMVQRTHKRCSFSRNRSVKCRMVQRKHNRSSFDVMIRRRNHQKYKRRMEQLRVNWDSSQWIGTAVIMTSPLRNLAPNFAENSSQCLHCHHLHPVSVIRWLFLFLY